MSVIETRGLTKNFKDLCAVDNVDLDVHEEVFGLLGPNGAGKSTIVKMLTTLIRPTKGEARICGFDVVKDAIKVRKLISYVPQEMAVDIKLTGKENVSLYADLYGIKNRNEKVREVIRLMGLESRDNDLVRNYSGGMRRRLELAQALVHEPKVLFLDEPTLGLDVAARKKIWEHIYSLKEKGMTIFMTTHYMDEADRYCDRVGIIDKGRIAAIDSPNSLKTEHGSEVLTVSISGGISSIDIDEVFLLPNSDHELNFIVRNARESMPIIIEKINKQGISVLSTSIRRVTLDDIFLMKVTAKEENLKFDGAKYRLMLRRR